MTKRDDLNKLKRDGAMGALLQAAHSKLWEARQECENARSNQPKTYRASVKKVRELLDESDVLFAEIETL